MINYNFLNLQPAVVFLFWLNNWRKLCFLLKNVYLCSTELDKRLINELDEVINDDRLLRMISKRWKKPFGRRNYLNAKPKALYWYFIFKSFNTMKLVITLILLLALTATAQNCKNCKPAIKIGTCPDYHCYHCGNNEILNIQSLNCDCIDGYYRVNGQCGQCP